MKFWLNCLCCHNYWENLREEEKEKRERVKFWFPWRMRMCLEPSDLLSRYVEENSSMWARWYDFSFWAKFEMEIGNGNDKRCQWFSSWNSMIGGAEMSWGSCNLLVEFWWLGLALGWDSIGTDHNGDHSISMLLGILFKWMDTRMIMIHQYGILG